MTEARRAAATDEKLLSWLISDWKKVCWPADPDPDPPAEAPTLTSTLALALAF